MTRNRAWCFTINNYTFEEMDACINLPVEYKVFGFEVGKKGTPTYKATFTTMIGFL